MANDHMKWFSVSLAIRETQIKISMRHHYIPPRMAKMKKMVSGSNSGEGVEKKLLELLVGK